jgi:hypothetical protein
MTSNQPIQEYPIYLLKETKQMRIYFRDGTSYYIYFPKGTSVYNLKNYNEFHNNYCDASILFLGNFSETELQSTNYYMNGSIEKIKNITNVSDIFCIIINTDDFDSYIK